jgi:hypothetical protein
MALANVVGVTTSGTIDENLNLTRSTTYDCLSDQVVEDPYEIWVQLMLYLGLPEKFLTTWLWRNVGQVDQIDTAAYLIAVDIRLRNREESELIWRVTLTHVTWGKVPERLKQASRKSVTRSNVIEDDVNHQTGEQRSIILDRVTDIMQGDKQFANSAGQPLGAEKVQMQVEEVKLVNYLTEAEDTALDRSLYRDTINDADWRGYAKNQVHLVRWERVAEFDLRGVGNTEQAIYKHTWYLHVHPQLWLAERADIGTVKRTTGQTPLEQQEVGSIDTDQGPKVAQGPMFLDGAGDRAPIPADGTGTSATIIGKPLRESNFSLIPFPAAPAAVAITGA